jgi:hypothetical protein
MLAGKLVTQFNVDTYLERKGKDNFKRAPQAVKSKKNLIYGHEAA